MLIASCSTSDDSEITGSMSNDSPIALYKTSVGKALAKAITSISEMQPESFDIDFDTVATTTESWLVISNVSKDTITDLSIKSDNPTFVVTPDTIVTMYPAGNSIGLMQMIKVTIVNGINSSGIGADNVIYGNQYATITISGNVGSRAFSTAYTFHAFGKRMLIYIDSTDFIIQKGLGTTHFAHVDSTSGNCYVKYYSSYDYRIHTIDTSYLNSFDLSSFEKLDSAGALQVTDSTMFKQWEEQENTAYAIILNAGYLTMRIIDKNCATLVMVRTLDKMGNSLDTTNVILP